MVQYEDQDPNFQLLESSVVRNLWVNEKNLTSDQIFEKQKKISDEVTYNMYYELQQHYLSKVCSYLLN